MPWHQEAMKDVGACDKLGLAGKQVFDPEISEWGNPILVIRDYRRKSEPTEGTETSKYLQERTSIETPLVVASERGIAQTNLV